MAKYVSKSEPKSKAMDRVFADCVGSVIDSSSQSNTTTALRKAMIQAVGERDFSAQETAHLLLSLPLYSCSYNFVTLSLNNTRELQTSQEQAKIASSLIDVYCYRTKYANHFPSIMSNNLLQFASNYYYFKDNLIQRSNPVIVRTFPKFSPDPRGKNYALYCKYQLIKLRPWHGSIVNAWDNLAEDDEMFIAKYKDFLMTDYAKIHVVMMPEELDRAERYLAGDTMVDDDDDDIEHEPEHHRSEWMALCQLNPTFQAEYSSDDISWDAAGKELPQAVLLSSANWISTMRSELNILAPSRQIETVNINTLTGQQRKAYNIVARHSSSHSTDPLRMLILGTAGTGKSYLIQALFQLLGDKCLLTGIAFHIGGITLHSALLLPVQSHNSKDLSGNTLASIQHKLKDKHYVIVDEVSMLGQTTMAWIDKRLRQVTTCLNEPFGGVSMIFIGDFAQLPPVADRPLYASERLTHGFTLYSLFTTVVILKQIVSDAPDIVEFRELLMRLRNGQSTETDWTTLLQRAPLHVSTTNSSVIENAIHLFCKNDEVAQFNMKCVTKLETPIACINAIHSCAKAATAKSDQAGGLQPTIHLAKSAKVMLTANLWQQTGLCNGSVGHIEDFLYNDQQKPPNLPVAVLVNFDDYSGPAFLPDKPKCIPIPPITFEWNDGSSTMSRQQLPLRLSYAITIHKSQGQTLSKVVIDLGDREIAAGCSFVALSRLKKLSDCLIRPMPLERLTKIGKSKGLKQRVLEEDRLQQLSDAITD